MKQKRGESWESIKSRFVEAKDPRALASRD